MFYLILYEIKRNKNYKNGLSGATLLFSKNKCGNTKIYVHFIALTTAIQIAKEDFHQLTQCCDNVLFMKKKLHTNTQSEKLAGKAFCHD